MTFKFLIDECLSPKLVGMVVAAGHVESTCIRDRDVGTKDWRLVELAVAEDYTLVTHNAVAFRGGGPGHLGGLHARQSIHAGLVCLNSVHVMDSERQRDLFHWVLSEIAEVPDLVNQALEAFEAEDRSVSIDIYDIPEPNESILSSFPRIENQLVDHVAQPRAQLPTMGPDSMNLHIRTARSPEGFPATGRHGSFSEPSKRVSTTSSTRW